MDSAISDNKKRAPDIQVESVGTSLGTKRSVDAE